MHILVLTHYWPPEIGASPHLTFELAETLVELGNRVTVVTGMPSYNMSALPEQYHGRYLYEEEVSGIRVLRIATGTSHSRSKFRRGLEHLAITPLYTLRALGVRNVDVVYTVSPPLTMGIAASLAARWHGARACLGVQDLFPQSAIDLGIMKNRLLVRSFEALERLAYAASCAITVHSSGNKDHIVAKGVQPARIHSIPNWVDTEAIRPGHRMNEFRAELGLSESDFVVSFAGTMGWSQGLDTVVQAARLLVGDPTRTIFVLVGDGTERQRLGQLAADLPNVRFVPMQPQDRYSQVLAASDACLVTLRPEVHTPVVPSKLLTIMAAARPVLASLPLAGDAPQIVQSAKAGIVSAAGDAAALADAIRLLTRAPDQAAAYGHNGREYAIRHFSRPACVRQFEQVLRSIARAPNPRKVPASNSYELPTTLPK
ncbi:MAG TPA: glycosyltransferase family 4 protein [Bryobacteraceae bacterium]|jgi:glycosyltransferase involved in cell wall biosynthesis